MRRDDVSLPWLKGTEESASNNFSVCLANVKIFLYGWARGGIFSSPVWEEEMVGQGNRAFSAVIPSSWNLFPSEAHVKR